VFIDETGISERPHRVRTWARAARLRRCSCTSIGTRSPQSADLPSDLLLQVRTRRDSRGPQVVKFLKQLRAQLKRQLFII
jgi:hypothetical protein